MRLKGKLTQETVRRGKCEYVVVRNDRGEIFHCRKSEWKRGLPFPPYRNIEEVSRPANLLSLNTIYRETGIPLETLQWSCRKGTLPAKKKEWKFGIIFRHGWLVDEADLPEFLAAKMIRHARRARIEWDRPALEVVGE